MHLTFENYIVYVFPNGYKRLAFNLPALTLKKLILRYGTPTKTTYSYEQVVEEAIK